MNEVQFVAAAVIVRAGRVLAQTRVAGSWQGYWEFPGGGRRPGESVAECIRRECLEEIDLAVDVGSCAHVEVWSHSGITVEVAFHWCAPRSPDEPRPCEGQELRWVDATELDTLSFLPSNAQVLSLLRGRFAP